jgi:hypothetical protein
MRSDCRHLGRQLLIVIVVKQASTRRSRSTAAFGASSAVAASFPLQHQQHLSHHLSAAKQPLPPVTSTAIKYTLSSDSLTGQSNMFMCDHSTVTMDKLYP